MNAKNTELEEGRAKKQAYLETADKIFFDFYSSDIFQYGVGLEIKRLAYKLASVQASSAQVRIAQMSNIS
jgi:hypothetical protein